MNSPPPHSEWPRELTRRVTALVRARGTSALDTHRAAAWSLLVEVLARFVRARARRAGEPDHAEIEDIAATKALELLARAESGAWDVEGRSTGEIVRYVERTARNGWLDHVEHMRREVNTDMTGNLEDAMHAHAARSSSEPAGTDSGPEDAAVARELRAALRGCIGGLPDRLRRVWFFRAYYEMSSRDIAAHPHVRLQAGHVDVLNQRARDSLRECMRRKGHDLLDVPRGAFVELWEVVDDLARAGGAEPLPERGNGGAT